MAFLKQLGWRTNNQKNSNIKIFCEFRIKSELLISNNHDQLTFISFNGIFDKIKILINTLLDITINAKTDNEHSGKQRR